MTKEQRDKAATNEAQRRSASRKSGKTAHQKDTRREWMSEDASDTVNRQETGSQSAKRSAETGAPDRERLSSSKLR